jgi:hypothetical protein
MIIHGGGAVLGSRFVALSSFSTSQGPAAIRIDGATDGIQQIAGYRIGNFSVVRNAGSAALVGVWVGGDGLQKGLIGLQNNQIHDIHVDGFSFCWRVANCRLIDFNRCSGWSLGRGSVVGLYITTDAAGAFTGDLNFNGCQFVVDLLDGTKCISLNHNNGGNAQIKGVRFNDTVLYHGDRFFEIYAASGALIGDIWINPGCQFDGYGHTEIHIEANGTGSNIDDIHIKDVYFRGFTNGIGLNCFTSNGGSITSVMAHGNWYASLDNGAKACYFGPGVSGSSFNFNTIQDFQNIDNLITINSSRNSVIGNILAQGAGATNSAQYMIAIGVDVDYCVIVNNNTCGYVSSGPLLILSTATHNILSPNV